MFDQFKLNTLIEFDKKQLEKILGQFKPKKVKRNTCLLNEGEVCKELYYVHSGCIRNFFIDMKAVEKQVQYGSSIIAELHGQVLFPNGHLLNLWRQLNVPKYQ